VILKAIYSPIK